MTTIKIKGVNADVGALTIHGQGNVAGELLQALGVNGTYFQGRREDIKISSGNLAYEGSKCGKGGSRGMWLSISNKAISFFPNGGDFKQGVEYEVTVTVGE